MSKNTSMPRAWACVAVALALAFAAAPASADQHGPDPSVQSVQNPGPYQVRSAPVPDSASGGFGAGTIYAPTDTSTSFGAITVVPGFLSPEQSIGWFGARLASHGFVVLTFNTNGIFDFPSQRGDQLLAALDWVNTSANPYRANTDTSREAVMGWSMGGGGTLEALAKRPSLKTGISLLGWNIFGGGGGVRQPGLVIGGENDSIASTGGHSDKFYAGLSGARARAYAILRGADHFAISGPSARVSYLVVSWMKRFVDDDTRYTQFLSPGPSVGADYSSYQRSGQF